MKGPKGHCLVSCHVWATCDTCKQRAEPCHIITPPDRDDGGECLAEFYCARCCPEHGAPLLAASDAEDRP